MIQIDRATDPFARQSLIPGWSQSRVASARVLVAGVGALGNACAADLVLSGVGHLVLVDNDHVETSNLSRTILFRRGDEGRRKVDVARERLAAMAPGAGARIVALDTDAVWRLGAGVYRRVDVVLGCLDSAEARAAVGGGAWSLAVPAIVGGIFGLDGGVVVQSVGDGACVACTFSAGEWAERAARYSCDDVCRVTAPRALVPATQVIASLTGALMVNEALQLLHGDSARASARLFLAGRPPALHRILLRRRAGCPFHARIDDVREDPALSAGMAAGALLERLASEYGSDVRVDLGRDFLLAAQCKSCGTKIPLMRPRHGTTERDLVCDACGSTGRAATGDPALQVASEVSVASPPALLDAGLAALGVPALHVLGVTAGTTRRWVELTGDLERLLPAWPAAAEQGER